MVLGLRVQLGGLHRATQVAATLKTTEVPLRNEVSPAHHRQRSTITLLVVLSFPFSQIYPSSDSKSNASFIPIGNITGLRRHRTYHHLEPPKGYQDLLESVVDDHIR